ncbi:S-adenosyl-L-methionine-dependent methyltransferase [Apiosordaria backusii]|uniref:S-adenosyl-L-methionine-dependent methyltransferase n=1 Tax=Apiosordaria backusii TaxID=314023 RepID=A0AA39ZUT4_9PEZI|nr:S-adenosyl-L-methionine-dependent methyltransferase [Apiosordaria backusii]
MTSAPAKSDDPSQRTPKMNTEPLSPTLSNRSSPPFQPPIISKMTIETLLTQDENDLLATVGADSTTGLSTVAAATLEKGKAKAMPGDSSPASKISPRGSINSVEDEGPTDSATNLTMDDFDSVHSDNYPASVTSSVRAHVFEGGLRYHAYKSGKYAFPNDETEQNRDDMKHSMVLLLMQGEFFYAPIAERLEAGGEGSPHCVKGKSDHIHSQPAPSFHKRVQRLTELRATTGTGTGIWAIELGDKYPNTTVTGIDLSPIQPNYVPENVHFFVDDFDEDWVDPDNKYDFIHIRNVMHSVRDTKALLARVMRHLKPGGYIEIQDIDINPLSDDETLTPTTPYALRDYLNYMAAGLRALGSEMRSVKHLPEQLEAAGFDDIKRTTHKAPIGLWPKDKRLRLCGFFLRTAMMDGLRGLSQRPMGALGWTPLQIEMVLVNVRKALMDPKIHAYFNFHAVYARKPLNSAGASGS